MGKLDPAKALELLRQVADAMAANDSRGHPADDARILLDLANRLIDATDPWGQLVLDGLSHALSAESSTSRHGARALAAMLRELRGPT